MEVKERTCEGVDWTHVAQDTVKWQAESWEQGN
jgi:hypothetical protein